MFIDPRAEAQRYKSAKSNALGRDFEQQIKAACDIYRDSGAATIKVLDILFC